MSGEASPYTARMKTRSMRGLVRAAVLALAAAVLGPGGCSPAYKMNETPYVMYGEAGRAVYARTPEALRTPDIPVIYVTDRGSTRSDWRGPVYTHERSPAVHYGIATVSVGDGVTWEELVDDSVRARRSRSYWPKVSKVEEVGEFAPITKRLEAVGGRLGPRPDAWDEFDREQAQFRALLKRYLDRTDRKEVAVFVHGYNNTFEDAVVRVADAWHHSGRLGVPIVYSWPAGSGGLKGYAYDRESGEFTIVHLKLLLMSLARCPEVEKVHVISHSRGTDVATTALRELHAECRGVLGAGMVGRALGLPAPEVEEAGPRSTRDVLKLSTLVLAAPDLDEEVFLQRFFGENLLAAADRTVVYFSKDDSALGLADWLFRSKRRVGAMQLEDFTPEARAMAAELSHLQFINCAVTGYDSHSYVLQHPAAMSDLILVVRDGRLPGADHGRPLSSPWPGMWELDNDYLKPRE